MPSATLRRPTPPYTALRRPTPPYAALRRATGMQTSVETSDLLACRASTVVPKRMKDMEKAIADRDFGAFAALTMMDSNSFHSTCSDTYPPIFYMTDASRAVVAMCHAFNDACGEVRTRGAAARVAQRGRPCGRCPMWCGPSD